MKPQVKVCTHEGESFIFEGIQVPTHLHSYVAKYNSNSNFKYHIYYLSMAWLQGWRIKLSEDVSTNICIESSTSEISLSLKLRPFPSSDVEAFGHIFINNHFKPFIDTIRQTSPLTDIRHIFDFGAYVGLSSLFFYREFPNMKLTAFEPDRESYDILKTNFTRNGLAASAGQNVAVWHESTTGDIADDFRDGRAWSLQFDPKKKGALQAITLPQSIEQFASNQPIDIIKMDIEGAEYKILSDSNVLELLRHKVRYLCLEIHDEMGPRTELLNALSKTFSISEVGEHTLGVNRFMGNLLHA